MSESGRLRIVRRMRVSDKLIARVAKALWTADKLPEEGRNYWRRQARVAIQTVIEAARK